MSPSSDANIDAVKFDLRTKMKQLRDDITGENRKRMANDVASHFMGNIPFGKRDVIAFYWPVGSEIDLTLLAQALLEQGHICVLPVVIEKDAPLVFKQYIRNMELVTHPQFRVQEPPPYAKEISPNIVIAPLLAFDKMGNRLGYGGGYYDRTLAELNKKSNIISVGVGYDFMQVSQVPTVQTDHKLDCVVTNKRVVICG